MIYVGIDDTDTLDTRGTNQLARALAKAVADQFRCIRIVRHQLLSDPRVPCTSKNGCASLLFEPLGEWSAAALIGRLRDGMRSDFVPGSDPGLSVAVAVPAAVVDFARRCQTEFIYQTEARRVAAECDIHLEGLGGTEDGVIGALAAIGLAFTGNDGRIVQIADWPDDLSGPQPVSALEARDVAVREHESDRLIPAGVVDVGKKLRPNVRAGRCVLFVRRCDAHGPDGDSFQSIKLP